MNNKIVISIVIVAVMLLVGYFLFRGSYKSPAVPPTLSEQPVSQSELTEKPISQEALPEETLPVEQNIVTYSDSGYSPATLTVKAGTTVTFKNESSRSMWTASGVHPTHRLYPTTGGCIASTFDACQGIQPGSSWSFKFNIVGTWKYHNHLNPSNTGTIVVE